VALDAIEPDFGGGAVRDTLAINQYSVLGRVGLPDDIGLMVASLARRGASLDAMVLYSITIAPCTGLICVKGLFIALNLTHVKQSYRQVQSAKVTFSKKFSCKFYCLHILWHTTFLCDFPGIIHL
jgi:hypothetical protein